MRLLIVIILLCAVVGCAPVKRETFATTAYCNCSSCCGWSRDFPDFWNRHYVSGPNRGDVYTGRTAAGTYPREPYEGLLSVDTLTHPWTLPHRLLLPWLWLAHDGTLAADWRHLKQGTRIYIPGYGWGRVEDKGSAIQGENRLDLYMDSHAKALRWGRKKVTGMVEP